MTTQPEALRLADVLERVGTNETEMIDAAAELRRLHEVNQELLEALKLANAMLAGVNMNAKVVERKVRAAINKATGEQA